MAVLFVTEYADIRGNAAFEPRTTDQTVAIGAGSLQSNAFNVNTRFIRVHTDAICSIDVGVNPTATAVKSRLAAGQTEYFYVYPAHKIAVITNT